MQDWAQRQAFPGAASRPGRRYLLAVLGGLGGAIALGLMPLSRARGAEGGEAMSPGADWRGRVAGLAGTYEGEGFRQEISATRGGFAIRQIGPPDLVAQKQWPSMVYSRVGTANYFAGLPADRVFTEHEVWWARFDPSWLCVKARFFDRRGARHTLASRRRLSADGSRMLWQVRLRRGETLLLDESLRLERL